VDLELSRIDDQRLREAVRGSYEIVAPRAGIVVGLEEVVGDTVVPGQTLLGLVSDGAVLKARLYARTDSAARLAEGLDVALRVGAFPYQKHGTLAGVVERVSMATVLPERSVIGHNAGVPLYVLDVRLASQTVTDGDRERPLKPGMEVTAELILDRRRLGRRLRDALTAL
jgi:membrane fusion protein